MAVVITNATLTRYLDDMLTDAQELLATLHLYKNDYTPLVTSVAGDFVEADFSGYAAWNFASPGNEWPVATLDGSNNAQSIMTPINFEHNGGATNNDIYGAYMLDGAGNLICAERYAGAPFTMDTAGAKFTVTPLPKLKR